MAGCGAGIGVRSLNWPRWGAFVIVLMLAPRAGAGSAVGDRPPIGIPVHVTGEFEGVRLARPGGPKGSVATGPQGGAKDEQAARRAETDTAGLRAAVEELRADVTALRERPEPASKADVERLHREVQRLAQLTGELARRVNERAPPVAAPDPPSNSTAGVAWLFLAAGLFGGWLWSRGAGRREQRSRIKL